MSAHILVIADGRSPTARSWIANIQAVGFQVSLVSTFYCDPPGGLTHYYTIPVALSRLGGRHRPGENSTAGPSLSDGQQSLIRRFAPLFQSMRYFIGPLTLLRFSSIYQRLVQQINPDLIHALRIPFEGMLGSYTPAGIPFLAATWGNDLTLHARGSPLMRVFTKRCLKRTDGLTADTQRDIHLASEWGLSASAPTLVIPGSGGLDLDKIRSAAGFDRHTFAIPADGDWVVNPRGIRPGSVHQDVFFAAIPEILSRYPNTRFICPGLAGNQQAQTWISRYDVENNTFLLPKLSQPLLWSLMKEAQLFVSPSSHDGTPNSLLEAMACGCFPVVGNIDSLREWVEDGVNGFLINPLSPQDLAAATCRALEAKDLRQRAATHNLTLVKERAASKATRPRVQAFYQQFHK